MEKTHTPDMPAQPERRAVMAGMAAGGVAMAVGLPQTANAQSGSTAWGWPTPHTKVSDKSVAWLKEKGWWPLGLGWQPPWSGQNAVMAVMDKQGFLAQRGLESKLTAFTSGPALNEVFISTRIQVGVGGNFPLNSLVDNKIPLKVISIICPNLRHHVIVPLDSPLKSVKDFKGGKNGEPYVIGIATGSSSEFYFQMMAGLNGINIGKDVVLKNMPPPEQLLMPKGIDAVVPWDYTCSLMLNERKNGRSIDVSYAYNIYQGSIYVRQELVDNVPDVVQALTDAIVEATLWLRLNVEPAVNAMMEDANLKNAPRTLLTQQLIEYNNWYKPTYLYPIADFWAKENERIAKWLFDNKRLKTAFTQKDFSSVFAPQFMKSTFDRLGWKIPSVPPTVPAGWAGKLGELPYPAYDTILTMKGPQAFPERGDLTKPYTFNGQTVTPA